VVLHVVGRDDGVPGRLPGGTQLPLLELGAPGRATASRGGAAAPLFPCAAAILAGEDPLPALAAAGDRRLAAAVDRFSRELSARGGSGGGAGNGADWEQVLFEALAGALGYSRNEAPMRRLAAAVPLRDVRRLGAGPAPDDAGVQAEAVLLGAAGLLPSLRYLPAARRRGAYAEALERAWAASGKAPVLRAYEWDTGYVRPENAPVRRVVALAHLALRWPAGGMRAVVSGALAAAPGAANRLLAAGVALACPPGYWAEHWDFGVPGRSAAGAPPALIGPSRAADAAVNVLLPLAAAAAARDGDPRLAARAQAAYEAHGALSENWMTRLVRERTGLAAGRGDRVGTARTQQGLIAIYEGPCRDLRCGECPLGQLAADRANPSSG
jgi:hypothetical protein